MRDLWYWYHTGDFPQQWHFSQFQAHVEEVLHNPAELVSKGLEEPGADPVWTRSFLHLHRLISHLDSGEGHIGAGGPSVWWERWVNVRRGNLPVLLAARSAVLDRGRQIGGLFWSADFPPRREHLFPPHLLSENEASMCRPLREVGRGVSDLHCCATHSQGV